MWIVVSPLFFAGGILHAQTVAWGTSFSEAGPIAYNSNGSVDIAQNIWTLGYFTTGFVPNANNFTDWVGNWNRVSNLVVQENPPGSGNFENDPRHVNFGDITSPFWVVSMNTLDVGSDAAGRQAYIFAYNNLSLIGTPQGEALLFRQNGLLMPAAPSQITFDIANGPEAADNDFTVIWGRVDRDMIQPGGVLQGGGVITNLIPDSAAPEGLGTFEAQFATWPIPEPSSAFLVICGASVALLRRRRIA